MSNGPEALSTSEQLSALIDGELHVDAVSAACVAWREGSTSRADWHLYHLIGDVLRSDDLASTADRDAGFLAALRVRMADEPVVFAPTPLPEVAESPVHVTPKRRVGAIGNSRWTWMAPSAVAAGFVVVAGALMVTGRDLPSADSVVASTSLSSPSSASPSFSTLPIESSAMPTSAGSAFPVSEVFSPTPFITVPNRQMIRDARLDRYLSAHKEFAGSTPLSISPGFVREATVESVRR